MYIELYIHTTNWYVYMTCIYIYIYIHTHVFTYCMYIYIYRAGPKRAVTEKSCQSSTYLLMYAYSDMSMI